MKSQKKRLISAVVSLMLLTCSFALAGKVSGPTVRGEVRHTVSLAVRDLGPANASAPGPEARLLVNTTAGLNFAGAAGSQSYSNATIAVGATQAVQLVFTSFTIYNKTTGTKIKGPVATNSLWSTFGGPCQTSNNGDGTVLYDQAAGRWLIQHHAVPAGGPYLNCIAVSTTSDATGTYNLYGFALTLNFPDKPKIGAWPDAYYMTQDLLNPTTKSFVRSQSCALDRTAMLAGTFAQSICFQGSISLPTFVPTVWEGTTPPPAGSPGYFWQLDQRPNFPNLMNAFQMHVDFVNPQNATFTGPVAVSLPVYKVLCPSFKPCVPQLDTTNLLIGWGDRFMYPVVYRNFGDHESILLTHSVQIGAVNNTYSGIRWYELRTPATPVIYQSGTFTPDTNYRWIPSIGMDKVGDIAMGYNVSSATVHPSLSYTGRVAADPLGTMETESSIFAGAGSQQAANANWSSYSSMTVDPVDDCTFWFTGQYYAVDSTNHWSTRIASFKFPSCQ